MQKFLETIILSTRSTIFLIGFFLMTAVHSSLCLFCFPLPFHQRYRIITLWAYAVMWWLKKMCGIDFIIEGKENLPASNAIILSNHQSSWETIAFQVLLPRNQSWVLKKELLWVPIMGWTLALLEPIAIDRKVRASAREQILKKGKQRLEQGRWVIIYPQGTRVKPGEPIKFARSGALLAANTQYPVIPVAHNAGKFWPRRGLIKKPGTIHVVIGPPIASTGRDCQEINRLAENWIQETLERIK